LTPEGSRSPHTSAGVRWNDPAFRGPPPASSEVGHLPPSRRCRRVWSDTGSTWVVLTQSPTVPSISSRRMSRWPVCRDVSSRR
jgi:hypothetical protein